MIPKDEERRLREIFIEELANVGLIPWDTAFERLHKINEVRYPNLRDTLILQNEKLHEPNY